MGKGTSKNKKSIKRNIRNKRKNNKTKIKGKPGRKQQIPELAPEASELLIPTINHFLPKLFVSLAKMTDYRRSDRITYSLAHLISMPIVMFLFHIDSRRQLREERRTKEFLSNLLLLTGTDEEHVADPDTMNRVLESTPPKDLERIIQRSVRDLIRGKSLYKFRFLDEYYLIAIDGVKIFSSSNRHCKKCLTREYKNGKTLYFHYALEAKLVTETGLALSIATEFIENPGKKFDKQDCERKAFNRIAKKLKKAFPRLPICLLLDGLYADEGVVKTCAEKMNWEYFIVFKEGSIPTLYEKVTKFFNKKSETKTISIEGGKQVFKWQPAVKYKEEYTNAIYCKETKETKEKSGKTKVKGTNYVWLTSFRPEKNNVEILANKGGRLRWKIENEGFNVQKNSGFELEHGYGTKGNALKNYYLLRQIAHMIEQLMTHGDLFRKLQSELLEAEKTKKELQEIRRKHMLNFYTSVKNFAMRLRESFRNSLIDPRKASLAFSKSIKIKLDSS